MASITRVKVSDILPNPFRKVERYKIEEEKIEALVQSYESTGFWDGSIQARPSPTQKGKVEIAFGHHRVEAARRVGMKTLGLAVGDRDNSVMLRMMADENREEFKHDPLVSSETIAAVVEAYGRGEIELESVDPKTRKGFIHDLPDGRTYTLTTAARFLSWTRSDGKGGTMPTEVCRRAFDLFRSSAAVQEAVQSVPSDKRSQEVVIQIQKSATVARGHAKEAHLPPSKVRQAEAKAAKRMAEVVTEEGGFNAREKAEAVGKEAARSTAPKKIKQPPLIENYVAQLISRSKKMNPYKKLLDQCGELLPYLNDLDKPFRLKLADVLEGMLVQTAADVRTIVVALRSGNRTDKTRLLRSENDATPRAS